MQILVVILYWIVVIPIIGYLQFKNLEIYKMKGYGIKQDCACVHAQSEKRK